MPSRFPSRKPAKINTKVLSESAKIFLLARCPFDCHFGLKIKGIGHWTASVVVSRAMGVFPYVAHNDVALQAAVSEYYGVPKSATALTKTFANFGEYAGLAAHFTLMRWVLGKYPVLR